MTKEQHILRLGLRRLGPKEKVKATDVVFIDDQPVAVGGKMSMSKLVGYAARRSEVYREDEVIPALRKALEVGPSPHIIGCPEDESCACDEKRPWPRRVETLDPMIHDPEYSKEVGYPTGKVVYVQEHVEMFKRFRERDPLRALNPEDRNRNHFADGRSKWCGQ